MSDWQSPAHLADHFIKHRHERPWRSLEDYDASARSLPTRDDVLVFGFEDEETGLVRVGPYDREEGLFTILSDDDRWIVSHFLTDWSDVFGLLEED